MLIQRRAFIGGAAAGALTLAVLPRRLFALPTRPMTFYHTHTGEKLQFDFAPSAESGVSEALDQLNYFLRDFRTEEVHAIDTQLLALLQSLYAAGGYRGQFEVISGFRSPKTNEALRQNSSGVAKNSWHMHGRAIDVRLTAMASADLYRAAKQLRQGGAGFYPKSDFVHIDTGPVRSW
jgi:uncharacterized protein YcbK (DUF882 family)